MADILEFIVSIPWWVWVLGFVLYVAHEWKKQSATPMTELERLELIEKHRRETNVL